MRSNTSLAVLALALVAAPLSAQAKLKTDQVKGRASSGTVTRTSDGTVVRTPANVPPGQLPPKGSCRVWIDGVPPGQQPAITDCVTAERNRVANSVVIYGDRDTFPGRGKGKVDRVRGESDDDEAEAIEKRQKREAKALKRANKDAVKAAKKKEKGNRDGADHDRDN